MTLQEWIELCPVETGAVIFSPGGPQLLIPKEDIAGMLPEWCGDYILLCAGLLTPGNEDLQDLVRERVGYHG
jgi:hypothetical protein